MKIISQLFAIPFLAFALLFNTNTAQAQDAAAAKDAAVTCVNWTTLPAAQKEKAETAHVIYRQFIKNQDFKSAFENWKIAYELAPAADGGRPFHYSDGRDIYMSMYKEETDAAKKKELAEKILRLYDEEIACYPGKDNGALLTGRKAYDMFYYLAIPYSRVLATLENTVDISGDKTEYIVLDPYARVVVHQFTNELMDKETARNAYERLNAIADKNIADEVEYADQYAQAKESMNGVFATIENFIFDCEFFYEKLVPEYKANPDDRDNYLNVYTTLVKRGCDKDDPILQEIAAKDRAYQMAELRENNKGYAANELYKEGDYNGAIAKYREAISDSTDPTEQAKFYFSIASIQFRKLNSYGPARESARKAASLDSSYGKPYELIGDMYATGARNCGNDAWGNSLAVLAAIDKYQQAKSVDPSLAGSVNKKINNYSASKPNQETGFMKGVKEGASATVPCWIGETVTVRY